MRNIDDSLKLGSFDIVRNATMQRDNGNIGKYLRDYRENGIGNLNVRDEQATPACMADQNIVILYRVIARR